MFLSKHATEDSSEGSLMLDDDNDIDTIQDVKPQHKEAVPETPASQSSESTSTVPDWSDIEKWTELGLKDCTSKTQSDPVHLSIGIDEAGRGSCLGPMIYGVCAVETSRLSEFLTQTQAMDSKQINHGKRCRSAEKMVELKSSGWQVFWDVAVVQPRDIDAQRLRKYPASLNEISMNTAFSLIERVIDTLRESRIPFIIDRIIFDAIGNCEYLQNRARTKLVTNRDAKLRSQTATIQILAESKADGNYTEVGAASIWAKLTRDRYNETWQFSENLRYNRDWGCGYPSDPATVKWLSQNIDPIFGFPSVARHSWRNVAKEVEGSAINVIWADDWESTNLKNVE